MAMIPSIFAILVMFLVMRLDRDAAQRRDDPDRVDRARHVARTTRSISSTTSSKAGRTATSSTRSRHTLLVAGRAILFATLINAGGFLAFALRRSAADAQFGMLAALAFVLSMIADFTALPAALWILSRERPAGAA